MNTPDDLRLKVSPPGQEASPDDLEEGTIVTLFSRRYGCTFKVRLDHLQDEDMGGHLVQDPGHPMFGPGDHLHFKRVHILEIAG